MSRCRLVRSGYGGWSSSARVIGLLRAIVPVFDSKLISMTGQTENARSAEDQGRLGGAGADGGDGRAAGAGAPGGQLLLGGEGEFRDQAVVSRRPAKANQGVAADKGLRHHRERAAGQGGDLE